MPVAYISRNDCVAYCEWLGEKIGKIVRLPTMEEWEYAARGGQLTQNYLYSGSDTMEVVGWSYDNSDEFIHPVMQLKPNELGLFDMTGNVWEWTSDLEGESMGYTMGGSYISSTSWVHADYDRIPIDQGFCHVGFRVVMEEN